MRLAAWCGTRLETAAGAVLVPGLHAIFKQMSREFKRLLFASSAAPPRCHNHLCKEGKVAAYLLLYRSGPRRLLLCDDCLHKVVHLTTIMEGGELRWRPD